jgi:hypothetical protein
MKLLILSYNRDWTKDEDSLLTSAVQEFVLTTGENALMQWQVIGDIFNKKSEEFRRTYGITYTHVFL